MPKVNTPFSKQRLNYAIDFHQKYIDKKMSNNKISRELFDITVEDKPEELEKAETIFRRWKRDQRMPPEMLSKLSKILNVSEKYLTGEWNEKAPAFITVPDMVSSLQGNDIIAKRTDPEGIYILPADEEEKDLLRSEAVMQTQHYINTALRRYYDSKSERWIEYSDIFDQQHFQELHFIIEKIVQTAAAQEIINHPDHVSLGAIFKQIESEPAQIITVELNKK